MILSGEKTEEYREIKPYWVQRLVDEDYKNMVSLRLHIQDISILKYFKTLINSNIPLSKIPENYKSSEQRGLIINNLKFSTDLNSLGMIPRKSLILKFPKIPIKYQKSFWD